MSEKLFNLRITDCQDGKMIKRFRVPLSAIRADLLDDRSPYANPSKGGKPPISLRVFGVDYPELREHLPEGMAERVDVLDVFDGYQAAAVAIGAKISAVRQARSHAKKSGKPTFRIHGVTFEQTREG